MAESAGRSFRVQKNGTNIAGVRVTGASWAGTPINVTSNDDAGIETYLADAFATETLELSVEGMTDDDVLTDIAFATTAAAKHLSDITLVRPNGDVVAGTFILTAYSETGNYQEAVQFSATLVRSGAHTFTQA